MEKFDVVIIGGGPAGLRAAKVLAEAGKNVALFEKKSFIGPKICAGGLTSKVFQLDIPQDLPGKTFYSMKVHFKNKVTEIKEKGKPLVVTIEREKLGQWMQKDAEKFGAKIFVNSEVLEIKEKLIVLKDGREVGFDYLIGADGPLSLVRKFLKVPVKETMIAFQYKLKDSFNNLEIFLDKNLFGYGYAWIFPHEKFTFVGAGTDAFSPAARSLKDNFHFFLEKQKIDVRGAELQSFPINYDYRGFEFGNKFLVGDAAGFTLSLIGEGVYSAIISGEEVAKKIIDKNYKCPEIKKLLILKKLGEKAVKPLIFQILKNKGLINFFIKKFCYNHLF